MSPGGLFLIFFGVIMIVFVAAVEAELPLRYRLWKQRKKYGELPSILGYNKVLSAIPTGDESIVSYLGHSHCKVPCEDVIVLIDGIPARHIREAHSKWNKGYYDRGVYYDQGIRKTGTVSVFLAGSSDADRIQFCKKVIRDFFLQDASLENSRGKFSIGSLCLELPYMLRPTDITQAMNQLVREGIVEVSDFGYYSLVTLLGDYASGKSKY